MNGLIIVFVGKSGVEKPLINPRLLQQVAEDLSYLITLNNGKEQIYLNLTDSIKLAASNINQLVPIVKDVRLTYDQSIYMTYFDIADQLNSESLIWTMATCDELVKIDGVLGATPVRFSLT